MRAAASTISGNGHGEKEDRHERGTRDQPLHVVLERAPGDPEQRLHDDGEHRRLDADEQRLRERQLAEGGVKRRQRKHRRSAPGSTNSSPAASPPFSPCSRQPT